MKVEEKYEIYNLSDILSPVMDDNIISGCKSLTNTDNRIGYINDEGYIYLYEQTNPEKAKLSLIKTDTSCIKLALGGKHLGYVDTNSNFYLSDVLIKFNFVDKHVKHIALGYKHAAFINTNNELFMFGNNDYGQLGPISTYEPKKVKNMVSTVVCGDYHTIYMDGKNIIYGTGKNDQGQLGLGHTKNIKDFQIIAMNVQYIYAGFNMTGAITDDILYLCGNNSYGQLTFEEKPYLSVLTETFDDVKKIGFGKDCLGILNKNNQLFFSGKYANKKYVNPIFVLDNCYDFAFANENFKIAVVYHIVSLKDEIIENYVLDEMIEIPYKNIEKYNDPILLAEIILDKVSFPYKKKLMENIMDIFGELQNYEPKFVIEQYKLGVDVETELIPLNYVDEDLVLEIEHNDIDDMADYFTEYARIGKQAFNEKYSLRDAWDDVKFIEKVVYSIINDKKDINSYELRKKISESINEVRLLSPIIPFSFYKKFGAKKILDLSVDWGSQLIAAIAYDPEKYVGYESDKLMKSPYNEIIEMFAKNEKYDINYQSFEKAKLAEDFDYIFFDPSLLTNNGLSILINVDKWLIDYLFKYLYKAWPHLKLGGTLTINLNDIENKKLVEPTILFIVSFLDKAWYEGVIPYHKDDIYNPVWIFKKYDFDEEDVSDYPVLFKSKYRSIYDKCLKIFK